MTFKKLVQLDDETWGWSEIDPIKLNRVTKEFKAWLALIDTNNDSFGFLKFDLPIVKAVESGEVILPYKGWEPHQREIGEGLLPREYISISSPFYNTIRGAHLVPPQIIEKNGKRYAWAEFEDYPDTAC